MPKITLTASTHDLDSLADALGRRADKEGMIKVPRDALGRMFCDHSKVLANIRSDSVIDVEEPGPVVGNLNHATEVQTHAEPMAAAGPGSQIPDDAEPDLLAAMAAA
jgi:hypothetical protein